MIDWELMTNADGIFRALPFPEVTACIIISPHKASDTMQIKAILEARLDGNRLG